MIIVNFMFLDNHSCDICEGACAVVNQNNQCLCDEGYQLSHNGFSCLPSEGTYVCNSVDSWTQLTM